MKLSEAMLLGSTMRPQAFGTLYGHDRNGTVTGTCALGAALEAVGDWNGSINCIWPWVRQQAYYCPECGDLQLPNYAGCVIPHLNDVHHWTRERIAEWVATVEPQEEPEQIVDIQMKEEVCV